MGGVKRPRRVGLGSHEDICGFVITITDSRILLSEVVVVRSLHPQERIPDCSRIDKVLLCNNDSLNNAVSDFCKMAHLTYLMITIPDPPFQPGFPAYDPPPPPPPEIE